MVSWTRYLSFGWSDLASGDPVERRGVQDNAGPAAGGVGRLDDERDADPLQVRLRELEGLPVAHRGQDDRVRDVDAVGDQFEVHRRLVRRVEDQAPRVDAEDLRPVDERLQDEVLFVGVGGPVEERPEAEAARAEETGGFRDVMVFDAIRGETPRGTFPLDPEDEIPVEFPVPGDCEVKMSHWLDGGIYTFDGGISKERTARGRPRGIAFKPLTAYILSIMNRAQGSIRRSFSHSAGGDPIPSPAVH